ncbi:helix-turn-helix domain-containing protein [Arthrobacter rhombi]|uniref:AraC-like ligand-binding domain-containing protein n=1 Tax=Arthrobacter rhombi TaxID=71253 RepID=UPI0031D09A07
MSKLARSKSVVSFDEQAPGSFAKWQALVGGAFPPLRIKTRDPGRFHGHVSAAGRDRLFITRLDSSGHEIARLPELISRHDDGYLKLSLHLAGSSLMVQDQHEQVLGSGDMTLYDTSRPYSMIHDEDVSFLVAMFPRDAIQGIAPDARSLAGTKIDGTAGLGAVVASYFRGLASNLDALANSSGDRLSGVGLDLIGAMIAEEWGAESLQPASVLLHKVYRHIEQHLADPGLSPASIAEAHFISVRHLHALFQSEPQTVAEWIRRQRLQRCRVALRDPLQLHRSVTELAAEWGFADSGYFSKLFRKAYGITPSSIRPRL